MNEKAKESVLKFIDEHFIEDGLYNTIDLEKTDQEFKSTNNEYIYQMDGYIDYESYKYNYPPSFKDFIKVLNNIKEENPEYFL